MYHHADKNSHVVKQSLHLSITLPAGAPDGHPHIIDLDKLLNLLRQFTRPLDMKAVDVIASVFYKLSPEMLHNLLDLSKTDFWFIYENHSGALFRVKCVHIIHAGSMDDDYELDYSIGEVDCWMMTGGADDTNSLRRPYTFEERPKSCFDSDVKFAAGLVFERMWRKPEVKYI